MKRYQYLDVARGIGMLLVVAGHSMGLHPYLASFFVQLFFVLSGCVYRPGKSYGENIAKKAARLLPPYFASSAALLLFYVLMGRSWAETKFSAIGILYSRHCLYSGVPDADNVFFFNIANGSSWYLTAFFTSSLIFHAVVDRCLSDRAFFGGCIAALTAMTMGLANLPILLPWSADIAFAGAAYMLFGAVLGQTQFFEHKWNLKLMLGMIVVYGLLVTINPGLNTSVRLYGVYGKWSVPLYLAMGTAGSCLCIWAAKAVQDTVVGKFLAYLGTHTVILLCFHILVLEMFGMVAERLFYVGGLTGVARWMYHAVRISVAIGGCLVLEKVLDAAGKVLCVRKDAC